MKIASCNVSGGVRKDLSNQLKLIFHSHNPDIVILEQGLI